MASRENQGLHIALILLVMLTIGLCILSFVFYSKAQNSLAEMQSAKNSQATAETAERKANYRAQSLMYMITGTGKSWSEIAEELENIEGASGEDPELDAVRRKFEDNMKLFGPPPADQELDTAPARNYESLPDFLVTVIRDLNQQLYDLRETEKKLTNEKANIEATAKKQVADAEAERDKARSDLAAAREQFNKDLEDTRAKWQADAAKLTEYEGQIADLEKQLEDERAAFNKTINDQQRTINDLKNLKRKYESPSFEVPDAIVTTINQKEGVLYIDVGSDDNLNVQQTFSVYDKGTTGVMNAKAKGRIEVLQILGPHVAMCRVLEDEVSNVIVPGDLVFTPAWSPGERIHFAIAGFIDITDNGRDDTDLLKRLIELNGGVVDDEVSVRTRYLVQGEDRSEATDTPADTTASADFDTKLAAAIEIGVDRLSPDKLLSLMGWRADVTTITLGTGEAKKQEAAPPEEPDADTNPFRKRTPPRGSDGAF